eukprot:6406677-Pyramimonas_sp.AAC.1
MLRGNEVADAIASGAAERCRLPSSVRSRIAEVEGRAALIRRRLLRATLEATVAEREEAKISALAPGGRASSAPAPPPPSPAVVA